METGPDTIPLGVETARLYLRAPLADTDARVVNESIRMRVSLTSRFGDRMKS